jgi:hypothetical protein
MSFMESTFTYSSTGEKVHRSDDHPSTIAEPESKPHHSPIPDPHSHADGPEDLWANRVTPKPHHTTQQPTSPKADLNHPFSHTSPLFLVRHETSESFGECSILKSPSNNFYIQKQRITNSKPDAQLTVNQLQIRRTLTHPNLQAFYDWSSATKSDWCSTFYQIICRLEYPLTTLKNQTSKTHTQQTPITHTHLLTLTHQITSTLCYLSHHHRSHEDIRPTYIGARSDTSYVLLDRLPSQGPVLPVHQAHIAQGDP